MMEPDKYDYKIKIKEKDKQNIIKGLFKIIEEQAEGIKQLCCDGRISGQVYDCETESLYLAIREISIVRDTLVVFKNLDKGNKNE